MRGAGPERVQVPALLPLRPLHQHAGQLLLHLQAGVLGGRPRLQSGPAGGPGGGRSARPGGHSLLRGAEQHLPVQRGGVPGAGGGLDRPEVQSVSLQEWRDHLPAQPGLPGHGQHPQVPGGRRAGRQGGQRHTDCQGSDRGPEQVPDGHPDHQPRDYGV